METPRTSFRSNEEEELDGMVRDKAKANDKA